MGVDVNSLKSVGAHRAGFWPDNSAAGDEESFEEVKLNNGKNYQVWIDYADSVINVTMAPVGKKKPRRPLLNFSLDLSDVFEDEMFIGFTGATGRLVEGHRILAWSFSNTNFSFSESLITSGLPSFVLPGSSIFRSRWFITVLTVISLLVIVLLALFSLFWIRRKQRMARERAEMEEWELDYWPHRVSFQEIEAATKGFCDRNVIGIGGNGKVYKGVLGGTEVAIKRISHENDEGMREFVAEISSLGRLKHRNLVGLRGWCKKEKGSLILVYDYMENGSLDKWVFGGDESKMLSCEDRIRILKDVAAGVLYLHEGWEAKVLHRDIKASNVLLDKEMNGRLGDFGLARMYQHGQVARTTRVVGTVGYLAPEVVRRGRASAQTDVYGFGILILEVICGRRPIEEGKPPLVEWVWQLMVQGEILRAVDDRIVDIENGVEDEEVEKMLHLGLLCTYPEVGARPTMRQVVKILEGKNDGYDPGSEDMEAYLLQKVKGKKDMWGNFSMHFGSFTHPTFDEIRKYRSSSMSLSWTNTLVEGR